MFSNGKFKNIVAEETMTEPLGPDTRFNHIFELLPVRTPTKNWIAVEGALFNSTSAAAETAHSWNEYTRLAPSNSPELKNNEDRNVFAIYVSYYVKIKLTLSGMGGEVSLKLPFLLGHVDVDGSDSEECGSSSASGSAGVSKGPNNVKDLSVSRVVPESNQCEVISEMCEMSLSNNNLAPEEQRTASDHPTDGPSMNNGRVPKVDNVLCCANSPLTTMKDRDQTAISPEVNRDATAAADGDEEDDSSCVPVISVATVQVHASNSRHSNLMCAPDIPE